MMFFFDTVQTFSSTAKTAKGKALQEMAERFKNVLVQGEDAPFKIVVAMREQAAAIDRKYKRGRETYIDHTVDSSEQSGQITAIPVSKSVDWNVQPYFRIFYHRISRTDTIPVAVDLVKGGAE